ncbi:MAG: hypothetical protein F6J87_17030 [Spirulina sp. SIO3F2]|nr:hypothetical protein [Spirulina sp. SIO3F2]
MSQSRISQIYSHALIAGNINANAFDELQQAVLEGDPMQGEGRRAFDRLLHDIQAGHLKVQMTVG